MIVDAVIEVNHRQRLAMIPKIEKLLGELKGKTVAILGLPLSRKQMICVKRRR